MEEPQTTATAAGRIAAAVNAIPGLWETYKRRVIVGALGLGAAAAIYGAVSFCGKVRSVVCGEPSSRTESSTDSSADEYY